MTRRQEIIATLLEWYEAVRESWNDGAGSGDYGLPMLCPVYNHPSYRELDRVLHEMRHAEPVLYRVITQRYLYAPTKVVLRCPKCGPKPERIEAAALHPKDTPQAPGGEDIHHKHAGTLIKLNPVRVRVMQVKPELLVKGIEWLDANWQGEPFVPDFEARAA